MTRFYGLADKSSIELGTVKGVSMTTSLLKFAATSPSNSMSAIAVSNLNP